MRLLALTCDTPQCLAFLLIPRPREADDFDRAAEAKWEDTHAAVTCPPCTRGAGPLLERGDCRVCGGRLVTRHDVELCRDCETPTRDNGPEWADDNGHQDHDDAEAGR
ncbi:hypothetical protein [Streptomyces sp. NPDC002580]|uniref:hypothetical protein n=1 Tax=Streptomyces sp. NPDC002580 TaxID=3364653 RepID=UPI0036C5D700